MILTKLNKTKWNKSISYANIINPSMSDDYVKTF